MNGASDIADGVYLGLDSDIYHRVPALSASGIKNLLISGPDFYYRCPWLNPNYADEDTEAMFIGRAYHKRILEGREAFYGDYAQTFEPPAECLRTVDDIKDALNKSGIEKPKGLKADLIEQLLEIQPRALILDELRADYEVEHHGKEFLSHDLIAKIETAAAMVEHHPDNKKLITGGYPEVSIFWQQDGLRFKARLDYLKPKAFIDLKTFGNYLNKPIDNAIYAAMGGGKIHIQLVHYMNAIERAKKLPVFGEHDPDWLKEFRVCQEHGCYVLFMAKGVAPLARAKKFLRGSMYSCGLVAIEEAVRRFQTYKEHFGDLPWIDLEPIGELLDEQYPVYSTEL